MTGSYTLEQITYSNEKEKIAKSSYSKTNADQEDNNSDSDVP